MFLTANKGRILKTVCIICWAGACLAAINARCAESLEKFCESAIHVRFKDRCDPMNTKLECRSYSFKKESRSSLNSHDR